MKIFIQKMSSELSPSPRGRGFTLVEFLIYLGLIGLVVGSFISFALSISSARNKNYSAQEVNANARIALEMISAQIRSAQGVNLGASIFDADPGALSLEMTDPAENPTIISLSADDGVLLMQAGAQEAKQITSDRVKVTNLVFFNLSGSADRENIRIELTITYNNSVQDPAYNYTQTLQTAVNVRK